MLQQALRQVALLDDFALLLQDAEAFLSRPATAKSGSSSSSSSSVDSSAVVAGSAGGAEQQLPAGSLQRVRDLQYEVQQLRAGLRTGLRAEGDAFSTEPEDYIMRGAGAGAGAGAES